MQIYREEEERERGAESSTAIVAVCFLLLLLLLFVYLFLFVVCCMKFLVLQGACATFRALKDTLQHCSVSLSQFASPLHSSPSAMAHRKICAQRCR